MINVLIVDDDRFARMGLISMIPWEKYGMQIVGEAANGKRALEFMRQTPVNLMFVDIAMPIMDGIELIRQVQQEFRSVRFVVLSFHEEFEYVQEALRLGALDYISKDKMEIEDYDGIMDRICRRLAEDSAESETSETQLEKLSGLLEGVLWLYDDTQMDEVLEELLTKGMHIRVIERLLAAALARVSSDTGVAFEAVPHLDNARAAAEFLRKCRDVYEIEVLKNTETVQARLMMAARYIRERCSQQIQASDVANMVNYSRSYFSISFKKILGLTFNAFVRRERIRTARHLLQDKSLSQAEIARRCGYGDIRNFKNAFCEQMGCTPTEYRTRC